ncbi:MAG: hypothetical protein CMO81_08580 [Waddliaceae bacterium]|nr:hypothetical protein [Waddliaceae bacterium]
MLIRYLLYFGYFLFLVLFFFVVAKYYFEQEKHLPIQEQKLEVEEFEDWSLYESPDGTFRVRLPTRPLRVKEDLPLEGTTLVLGYDVYTSDTFEGASYEVTLITYPEEVDTEFPEVFLTTVANEVLAAQGAKDFAYLDLSDYQEHDAIMFRVETEEAVIAARALFVDKTLYLLMLSDLPKSFSQDDFQMFADSFELVSK